LTKRLLCRSRYSPGPQSGLAGCSFGVSLPRMFEYQIYGERILSDTSLYEPDGIQALSPSLSGCVELIELVEPEPVPVLAHTLDFSDIPLREVILSTDQSTVGGAQGNRQWRFHVGGVCTLAWRSGDARIGYRIDGDVQGALFGFWVVHVFLPLYLALEKQRAFLHAMTVEVDAQAVLFTAPSYGGKSTLGSFFINRGHALLSDDKAAITVDGGRYVAHPSHPFYRPERLAESMGRTAPDFCASLRPVRAIYLLQRGPEGSEPFIEQLTGAEAFQSLLSAHLYAFGFHRQERLEWLSHFVDSIGVYRLSRPWGMDIQALTYEAVRNHLASLVEPAARVGVPVKSLHAQFGTALCIGKPVLMN